MYSQPEDILKQYDLEISQVAKGRGYYICTTNQGKKVLMPYSGSKEKGTFLKTFLEHLQITGWETQQIMENREQEVVSEDELGNRYILKDMWEGSEIGTKNLETICQGMKLLGEYHSKVKNLNLDVPKGLKDRKLELCQQYEKHSRELNTVYHYVKKKKKKNDFEQQFMMQFPELSGNMENIVEEMSELQKKQKGYLFCHGDYNQHNIIEEKRGLSIINFEGIEYNLPVVDMAHFMRKILEKNGWREDVGIAMVEAYEMGRKIPEEERQYLYLMLQFPEKLWKLANHYYNSHKAWMSGRDLEKLVKISAQEEHRQQFIQNLFSFFQ